MLDIIAIPFGYLMRFCYMITSNYALALILFTIFFKLILLPLNIKQHRSSQAQARVRPKEAAIRKRYAGRADEQARLQLSNELMALYKEEKVSLAGGCLPLLVQLPIILALYQIVTRPLTYLCQVSAEALASVKNTIFSLYSAGSLTAANTSESIFKLFNNASGQVDKFAINELQIASVIKNNSSFFADFLQTNTMPDFTIFGGALDLSATPVLSLTLIGMIPFLVGIFQFASTKVMQLFTPKPDTAANPDAAQTAKTLDTMNIIMPVITVFFAFSVPAILGLYWIYQSVFSAVIQIILSKAYPIPKFTPEEYAQIEAEMNKDYVIPEIPAASARRSLHHIDDDEEEDYQNLPLDPDDEWPVQTSDPDLPRRRYDKDGNKIHSLHYIDEDEETTDSAASENTDDVNDTDIPAQTDEKTPNNGN